LTKIRCGIRENANDLDGVRDLTATREARFARICTRDAGFFCLSVENSGNRHDPIKRSRGKRESARRVQTINRKDQSTSYIYELLQKLVFFNVFFWKEKTGFGIVMKKCGMRDSRKKGAGMEDQDPLPDPVCPSLI